MKIIDACCGIGPTRFKDPLLPYTAEQTLAIMDQCGIDAALAYDRMAAAQGEVEDGNAALHDLAARNERFLPAFTFGMDPYDTAASAERSLALMREANCRAAWVWPPHGGQTVRWVYGVIFALCEQVRLPLLLSKTVFTPDDIYQIGGAYPRLPLVLSGMEYMADGWLFPLLRALPELRVCYGHYYIPSRGVERFVRHFGAHRLLFGSGLPEYAPGGLLGYVHYADISPEDKALILGGNLETLMAEVRYA